MLFVFQVNRLNAKIEKPPGVTNVLDDTYNYVRTRKRPLEAVETPMMGGEIPPYAWRWGTSSSPINKLSSASLSLGYTTKTIITTIEHKL